MSSQINEHTAHNLQIMQNLCTISYVILKQQHFLGSDTKTSDEDRSVPRGFFSILSTAVYSSEQLFLLKHFRIQFSGFSTRDQ